MVIDSHRGAPHSDRAADISQSQEMLRISLKKVVFLFPLQSFCFPSPIILEGQVVGDDDENDN